MADLGNNAGENIFKAIDIGATKWDLSHNPKFGVDL